MKRNRENKFDDLYDELLGDCPRDEFTYNNTADDLKWIKLYSRPWTIKTFANAAANGHLGVLKWLDHKGCPWKSEGSYALNNGQIQVQRWDMYAWSSATKNGQLEVLEWLYENGCNFDVSTTYDLAMNYGHLEILKWLYTNNFIYGNKRNICRDAAEYGYLEILKWARTSCVQSSVPKELGQQIGCYWDDCVTYTAAKFGNYEILRWALINGCPMKKDLCILVAKFNKHVKIVNWLEFTCNDAALNGDLEVLKWTQSKNYSWNEKTSSNAALNGHWLVLKWLLDNGCPMNKDECLELAAEHKHEKIVTWLKNINH